MCLCLGSVQSGRIHFGLGIRVAKPPLTRIALQGVDHPCARCQFQKAPFTIPQDFDPIVISIVALPLPGQRAHVVLQIQRGDPSVHLSGWLLL